MTNICSFWVCWTSAGPCLLNKLWEKTKQKKKEVGEKKRDLPPSVSSCSDIAILSPTNTLFQLHADLTQSLGLCFHASSPLWYLPCPDCQAQGHERRRGRWAGVWRMPTVCVHVFPCMTVLCMRMCVRANVQVNRKLSGTRICLSSDNSRPQSPPSDSP